MSIIRKKERKKMELSYFERKFEYFVYVHMDIEKKTLTLVKQSQ